MKFKALILSMFAMVQIVSAAWAQDVDGSLYRDQRERENRFVKLSVEDQIRVRAVEQGGSERSERESRFGKAQQSYSGIPGGFAGKHDQD